MTHIDDLPAIDIWPLIFKNLSIKWLLNCRLVNKKFKNFSSNCVHKLIISEFDFYPKKYWEHNKRLIGTEEIINYKFYQQINSFKLFNLDKSLKYLIINGIEDKKFKLKELSYLNNLKYLEIENLKLFYNQCLELENLIALKFERLESKCIINLNLPKLKIINFDNLKLINFVSNPESIIYLKIDGYEDGMCIFKNLEIIELNWLEDDLFKIFIKLKKINFYNNYYNASDTVDVLKKLLDKNKNLNKEIYFKDVKIDTTDKLDEYDIYDNDFIFQINNYYQLDSNLSFTELELNYNDLENWYYNLKNDLTTSFFDKFFNLQIICIDGKIKNINHLSWFLRNLKNLNELNISNVSLNQKFYNNLPKTIKKLKSNETKIDYNFILKLTNLIYFKTNNHKNHNNHNDFFDLASRSFEKLKCLEHFEFQYNMDRIKITKFLYKFTVKSGYSFQGEKEINCDRLVDLYDLYTQFKLNSRSIQFFF